jgi:hypothetical protein
MEFFGREPFAIHPTGDDIPSIPDVPQEYRSRTENGKIVPGVSGLSIGDGNQPDQEIRIESHLRDKENARKRGIATDWNPETGEILALAFYNSFSVDLLNKTLAEAKLKYGKDVVEQMAISLAVGEARERRFDLHRWGFEKVESRCNARYWTFVSDLTRKKKTKPRVVDVTKPEPASEPVELKFNMSLDEMQSKQRELDELRARIAELAGKGIS